jgi:hypothetical protein
MCVTTAVYTTSCHHEKRSRPWARKSSKEFNKAIYLWNESDRTPKDNTYRVTERLTKNAVSRK